MTSTTAYPLDVAKQSLWHQIVNQPLPARPEGFFLSPKLYRASLHPLTPLTIGFLYICAVRWANNRNKRSLNGKKDFINSSPTLKNLVLTHNLFLAIYSLWTCANVVVRLVAYFAKGYQAGGLEGQSYYRYHSRLCTNRKLFFRPDMRLLHCPNSRCFSRWSFTIHGSFLLLQIL